MRPEIILRGGRVIDGKGGPARDADVGLASGRIVAMGHLPPVAEAREIDAQGLTVAPGFIDIHSHSDLTLLVDPRAASAIAQGVTTEVVGNCGHGCAPVCDPAMARVAIYGPVHAVAFGWRSVAGYFEHLAAARPAVNVLALVPNGQLRLAAVGSASRPATSEELADMVRRLEEGLEQGAAGFSTGLEYAQESGASEQEITALCAVVARRGALYATHTRDRDEHAAEAVQEAVRTARATGVRLQVSHIVPRSGPAITARCIEAVQAAQRDGLDADFDMHTRFFGFTHLKNLLPGWAFDGGAEALTSRLRDASLHSRFAEHRNLITSLGDWNRVLLVHSDRFEALNGRSLLEIGKVWSLPPFEAALRILLGHADDILRPKVILQSYSETLLRDAYAHSSCMVGSDATTLSPDGPLAEEVFYGAYTWAAWFYRRMVRETGMLSPEAAIARLSALPARKLGLTDRGVLEVGARGDLIAFEPAEFGEMGTVAQPNRLAKGMRHVIVNGIVTMQHGVFTGERGGAVIRRVRGRYESSQG
ncbi:MAG: amidohydrolase family protein [Methylobacteriaceae bacterium]|nr:amidohydrolase family protein [Methylobacteriaceae bacterium]